MLNYGASCQNRTDNFCLEGSGFTIKLRKLGSRDWDRTNDKRINSALHYRCATLEFTTF